MPLLGRVAFAEVGFCPPWMRLAYRSKLVPVWARHVVDKRTPQLADQTLELRYPIPQASGLVDVGVIPGANSQYEKGTGPAMEGKAARQKRGVPPPGDAADC